MVTMAAETRFDLLVFRPGYRPTLASAGAAVFHLPCAIQPAGGPLWHVTVAVEVGTASSQLGASSRSRSTSGG
jgi:hypothetical protein